MPAAADAVHGEQDAEGQTDQRGEQHEGERASSVLLPGVDELLGAGGGGRDDERDEAERARQQETGAPAPVPART